MKKTTALLICLFTLFITQLSVRAATYDASGWWDVNYDRYVFGAKLLSGSWTMYIDQNADDTFGLNIDGSTNLYWQGDITNDHYSVSSCNWEEWVPIASDFPGHDDTGFIQAITDGLEFAYWAIMDTTNFWFDLSSPTNLSGEWHSTWSGWMSVEPDHAIAVNDPTLWDDASPPVVFQEYNVFSASKVPIPSAIWLLGSGLIGLVGFRKKFKKT